MSVSTGTPYNQRRLEDATYVKAAGIAATCAAFDLVQAVPYPVTDKVDVKLEINTTGATTTTGSLTLQDSADNVTFTNVAAFAAPVYTVNGTESSELFLKLQPTSKRYVRVSGSNVAEVATGGYTASLVF